METVKRHIESAPLLSICFALSLVFLALYNFGDPGPNYHGGSMVVFCNDASYGMQSAAQQQLPGVFTGKWNDLNWLGNEDVTPSINMTAVIALYCKYVAPLITPSPLCEFFVPILATYFAIWFLAFGPSWRAFIPESRFGQLLALYFLCFFGSAFIGLWNWPQLTQ